MLVFSELFFKAIVFTSLIVIAIAAVVLVTLFVIDYKKNTIW